MKWFACVPVYLLTLVLMIGSILNVHTHYDLLSSEKTETSKEVKDSKVYPLTVLLLNSSIPCEFNLVSAPQFLSLSQNFISTHRLLLAHRIALPPPIIS